MFQQEARQRCIATEDRMVKRGCVPIPGANVDRPAESDHQHHSIVAALRGELLATLKSIAPPAAPSDPNVVLLTPNPEWVKTLPNGKLPDRNDFYRYEGNHPARIAAWHKAIGACKSLEPPGFMPTSFTPKQLAARLKFAQCVRASGVPSFPDPTAHGPLVDVQGGQSIPGLHAAIQKCIRLNPEAVQ